MPLKAMKRKEFEEVNDEFSDFSLSSPATKIRRLDAGLPPIMEEDEYGVAVPVFDQSQEQSMEQIVVASEFPAKKNEERAIVLFNPINNNTPLSQSPSAYTISSDILSGLKNQVLWSNQSNLLGTSNDKSEGQDENLEAASNGCLAVVPWVPSQLPSTQGLEIWQADDVCEMMEDEEMGVSGMDIEEENNAGIDIEQRPGNEYFGGTIAAASEGGLHQWQQQHCMVLPQQLPQNASPPPIVWFQ